MKRQLSFQEYRSIDLGLFAIMSMIFEFIIIRVSNSGLFIDASFTVSLAGALVSIVYMRWGFWGAIHAALFGLIDCMFSAATLNQYLIYISGNLFSVFAVFILKWKGYETMRTTSWYWVFPLCVILLMQIGRALVSMLLGTDLATATAFITTDSLSILFTLVIVWVTRRLDGVYENQKHYLLRVHDEEKNSNTTPE